MAPDSASERERGQIVGALEDARAALVDGERRARYRWAGSMVPGGRALDVGCGSGDGAAVLARAGVGSVVGIDGAEAVIEASRRAMPDGVVLEAGDVSDLGYDDHSFDLVTCFGAALEAPDRATAVLDEVARVLAPGGRFLIRVPAESAEWDLDLELELQQRWSEVAFVRQTGESVVAEERIAVACDREVGELPGPVATFDELDFPRLLEALDQLELERARLLAEAGELCRRLEQSTELAGRIVDLEQALAAVPELEIALERAREDLAETERARLETAERLREITGSRSWRATELPRRLGARLRRDNRQDGASG